MRSLSNYFSITLNLFRLYIFWMLMFALGRAVFLVVYWNEAVQNGFGITLASFYHAIPLDTSAACYILLLPCFLLMFEAIIKHPSVAIARTVYMLLILLLFAVINSSEITTYTEWRSKLNYKELFHLSHPGELFRTGQNSDFVKFAVTLIIQMTVGIWLYFKLFYKSIVVLPIIWWKRIIYAIPVTALSFGLLVLGIRGGFQPIPVNQSSCMYSKVNILNDATINPAWNLADSYAENLRYMDKNPYLYYPLDEARKTVTALYYMDKDTTIQFLTTQRPNVVLLILESWSADLIEDCGGLKGITPQFKLLADSGYLFTNLYATGHRSDMGMAGVLSSYPAQPTTAIISQQSKFSKISCINKPLQKLGYTTSYYFGGQLEYGHIKEYIIYNRFDRVLDQADFDSNLPHGRLGVHDKYTLQRQLDDLNKEKQPFLSVLFTLSTHPPYDMPMEPVIHQSPRHDDYLNAAYYTDKCLGDYFREAKKQKWYDSTLFIIVADHGHDSPREWEYRSKDHYHIPLLFYGNVIKPEFRGKKNNKVFSQIDINATLLAQMGLETTDFPWSKNMMNPYTSQFAYYAWYDGLGWIRPDGYIAWDNAYKTLVHAEAKDSTLIPQLQKEGQSYLETMFQEFLNY